MSTAVDDLVAFIEARLTEDERTARAVLWEGSGNTLSWYLSASATVEIGEHGFCTDDRTVANHILNHDPARVLRDIAGRRILLAEHTPPLGKPQSDAELHRRWAHPAYEYTLTEGQRKAWDDVDTPPEGDGWERNTDAGRDGWDRLDYTEESYWRRLRPAGPRPPYIPTELRVLAAPYATHPDFQPEWALTAREDSR